jgi:hypothetical protein
MIAVNLILITGSLAGTSSLGPAHKDQFYYATDYRGGTLYYSNGVIPPIQIGSSLTASYATYSIQSSQSLSSVSAVSSSYAVTAVTSNYALTAGTSLSASFAAQARSASYALTASYLTGVTSGTASFAVTASYALTASYLNGFNGGTASWAISASRAISSETADSTPFALTASYALNAGTVPTASFVVTASGALSNLTASYALTASYISGFSVTASWAVSASRAVSAETSVSSSTSISSSYALTASFALNAASVPTGSFVVTASGALSNSTASYALTASYMKNQGTSSGYIIGNAMDGFYGPGSTGSVANIQEGDRVEDALNKIDDILFKLAPARPPNLSTKSLTLGGIYTANLAGTNTAITTVTTDTTPLFTLSGGMTSSNAFGDGDAGELSASLNGTTIGSRLLSAADDSGSYGDLGITLDIDYYLGQAGKAGFWKALLAQVNVSSPIATVGPHSASLKHTTTGQTPDYIFYIDTPVTPTAVTGSVVASGVTYISGVPALVGGVSASAILLSATASNTVGRFYNTTRIFQGSGTGVTAANFTLPSSPASGSIQSGSRSYTVNASSTTENASYTVTAYNSFGTTATNTITNTRIRMDSTVDPSTRVRSGQGHYPTSGSLASQYAGAFDSTTSLSGSGSEELQMLNGQFQYPTGNYTGSVPVAGPNYSSVPTGSFNNFRWVTFNMGSIVNKANIQVNFSNTTGFTTVVLTNFQLGVRVEGSTPTAGWVDGNVAFPGVGDPTNNGDAALVIASSTATSKLVTFGTAVKTGTVFVRVGIPLGDTKKFGGITITAT